MAALLAEKARRAATWPLELRNAETGRVYTPHHAAERAWVESDAPRYGLLKGGEGSGKSTAGIVKDLRRLARGMSGILVSPDFEHFKKSLWPEFRRWCPPSALVEKDRYRLAPDWEAHSPFEMHFRAQGGTVATLYCGGIEDPSGWEGPNVNFAHFDEARRHKTPAALKVLDGRVRIPGPLGETPQLYLTTTPRKHWLYDYFGPLKEPTDERADFKADSLVVTLLTADNERAGNVEAGYTRKRAQSLNESEQRVLLEAEWEDIDDLERFLPSLTLWDACREDLPGLGAKEPLVVALDAATSSDSFGMVGVTRHPARPDDVAVRFVQEWKPRGGTIDFQGSEDIPGPERVLRNLIRDYNVVVVVYDPYQLHDMATRLRRELETWFEEFPQTAGSEKRPGRLIADKQLLDLIVARRIAHDGHAALRQHLDNADRKPDPETRRLRIVKREAALKVDLAVCLSMAACECLRLSL